MALTLDGIDRCLKAIVGWQNAARLLKRQRDEALKALEQKTDRVAEVIAQREEAYGVVAELDAQMRRVRRGG